MVDSTKTDQKDLLKNKRFLKGTPLYRLATRYAGYWALSLGCLHISIGYVVYNIDVDEFWLIGGRKQLEEQRLKYNLHFQEGNDELKLDQLKDDFRNVVGTSPIAVFFSYCYEMKNKYFSSAPGDSKSQPSETVSKTSSTSIAPSS